MEPMIETSGLTKDFGGFRAVDGLSLSIARGEIYGFLGLNGAGKTSTIRMLLGLIRPTAGAVRICGETVGACGRGPWRRVGSLVEVPYAYPDLTVRENLEIVRLMRGIADARAVDEMVAQLGLGRYADKKAGRLSLGNAQRLGLAKALLHRPDILILDEPSNALDPAGIVEIRDLLLDLGRNGGVTIFVSSHLLDEVARIADRIGIIHEGRLMREMDREEIGRLRARRLLLGARDIPRARELLVGAGHRVAEGEDGVLVLCDERALREPDAVASLLVQGGVPPTMLREERDNLEDLFLRIIGRKGESDA